MSLLFWYIYFVQIQKHSKLQATDASLGINDNYQEPVETNSNDVHNDQHST